jgi:hypothetical protein
MIQSGWGIAASVAMIAVIGVVQGAAAQTPPYLGSFPNFEAHLTPQQLPGDVDVALKRSLEGEQKFPEVQRLFDLWSWQAFISLNWPTDGSGKRSSDTTLPPAWSLWTESTLVFLPKGAPPPVCKTGAGVAAAVATNPEITLAHGFTTRIPEQLDTRRVRLLAVTSAVNDLSALIPTEDIQQAFSGPIVDQNGNFVFYEILIDKHELDYICQNKLYSIAGQEDFAKTHSAVDLPSGVDTEDASGAFELKLAWKILASSDDASRYLTAEAKFPSTSTVAAPALSEATTKIGLVGMHIAHKSASSKQWIWSTFEQVDNLAVDSVAHPTLKPSFFDPSCAICAANQKPAQKGNTWLKTPKTQIVRSIPIPPDKETLNREAEAALATAGSPLRYYQLIDTQWPTAPSAPPTPWNAGLPGAVENKPGGNPTPVYLTNTTMETYFQGPSSTACQNEELPTGVQCPVTPWASAEANDKNTTVDSTPIFATESCMGCHSSASFAGAKPIVPSVNTKQLTGDFSWLFSQKAQ